MRIKITNDVHNGFSDYSRHFLRCCSPDSQRDASLHLGQPPGTEGPRVLLRVRKALHRSWDATTSTMCQRLKNTDENSTTMLSHPNSPTCHNPHYISDTRNTVITLLKQQQHTVSDTLTPYSWSEGVGLVGSSGRHVPGSPSARAIIQETPHPCPLSASPVPGCPSWTRLVHWYGWWIRDRDS